MAERNQFLKETECLGETDPHIRAVANALYVQYKFRNTMQLLGNENRNTYMQAQGAIRALEALLQGWGRLDLLKKLSELGEIDFDEKVLTVRVY